MSKDTTRDSTRDSSKAEGYNFNSKLLQENNNDLNYDVSQSANINMSKYQNLSNSSKQREKENKEKDKKARCKSKDMTGNSKKYSDKILEQVEVEDNFVLDKNIPYKKMNTNIPKMEDNELSGKNQMTSTKLIVKISEFLTELNDKKKDINNTNIINPNETIFKKIDRLGVNKRISAKDLTNMYSMLNAKQNSNSNNIQNTNISNSVNIVNSTTNPSNLVKGKSENLEKHNSQSINNNKSNTGSFGIHGKQSSIHGGMLGGQGSKQSSMPYEKEFKDPNPNDKYNDYLYNNNNNGVYNRERENSYVPIRKPVTEAFEINLFKVRSDSDYNYSNETKSTNHTSSSNKETSDKESIRRKIDQAIKNKNKNTFNDINKNEEENRANFFTSRIGDERNGYKFNNLH